MLNGQDDNLDPGSSSDPTLDAAAKTDDQVKTEDASSSNAAQGENDDSLLSVVRDVVKDSRKDQSTAASPAEGEEKGSDDQQKKQDDEEYSDVPFNKHPRFQQLLRSNKVLKADAERYHNVVGFLEEAGLSEAEAADGLQIMAKAKVDPAGAWADIKPWVQKLLVAAGEVLPDDLRQRVESGEITKEVATELSRARAAGENAKAEKSFREQQAERRQQTGLVNELRGAATSWENDRRLKDPNFDAKYEAIQKEVAWLIRKEGQPNTADGVKDQLRRAYKSVNDQLASAAPAQPAPVRKPAITPVRGGQVAGNQQQSGKEMSTLDIVRANRRTA